MLNVARPGVPVPGLIDWKFIWNGFPEVAVTFAVPVTAIVS
jgi:hypothetical protein